MGKFWINAIQTLLGTPDVTWHVTMSLRCLTPLEVPTILYCGRPWIDVQHWSEASRERGAEQAGSTPTISEKLNRNLHEIGDILPRETSCPTARCIVYTLSQK